MPSAQGLDTSSARFECRRRLQILFFRIDDKIPAIAFADHLCGVERYSDFFFAKAKLPVEDDGSGEVSIWTKQEFFDISQALAATVMDVAIEEGTDQNPIGGRLGKKMRLA